MGEGQTQSLEQARQALHHRDTPRSGFLNFPRYSVLEMEIEKASSKATKHVVSSLALSFVSSYLQALGPPCWGRGAGACGGPLFPKGVLQE